jgi:hypothetical protein
MFSFVNTHAVLDIIALGTRINHESIQQHMEYFTQQLSQSCKTCSNFLRVKFKVFKPSSK